jgi:hypothetical protein
VTWISAERIIASSRVRLDVTGLSLPYGIHRRAAGLSLPRIYS